MLSSAVDAENNFNLIKQQPLPKQLGDFRQIEFTLATEDDPVVFYAATLNENYRASIYQQPEKYQFFADYIDELSRKHNFVIATNGGFYRPDFTPAGLYIDKGKKLQEFAYHSLLKPCVVINKQQKIKLETSRQNCLNGFFAMQTGPVLIDNGEIQKSLTNKKVRTPKLQEFFGPKRRTLLAVSEDNQMIVIITSPIALSEAATILQNYSAAFGVKKIKTAINLDGGSSTGMYVRFSDDPFYFHEQRHVKTFLFID